MQILIFFTACHFFTVMYDVRQLNVIDLVCYGTKMDYSQTGYCTADIHKQLKFRNSIVFKLPEFLKHKKQAFMLNLKKKMSFYTNNDCKQIYYIVVIIMNLTCHFVTSQNTTCDSPGM